MSAGWTNQSFPVAGTSDIESFKPLYNEYLGVWNLKYSPTIYLYGEWIQYKQQWTTELMYTVNIGPIVLNPAIAKDLKIENQKSEMLFKRDFSNRNIETNPTPAFINLDRWYSYGKYLPIIQHGLYRPFMSNNNPNDKIGLVKVSFDLVNKSTNKIETSFVKYFQAPVIISNALPPGSSSYTPIWVIKDLLYNCILSSHLIALVILRR